MQPTKKRKPGVVTIDSFFAKTRRQERKDLEPDNVSQTPELDFVAFTGLSESDENCRPVDIVRVGGNNADNVGASTSRASDASINLDVTLQHTESDIGFYVSSSEGLPPKLHLTDSVRTFLARQVWRPSSDFVFPKSGPRNLAFQLKWMSTYPWLAYSKREDSAYCLWCVLFSPMFVGKGAAATTGQLVSSKFNNWKKAKEKFEEHKTKGFHEHCRVKFNYYLTIDLDGKQDAINLQLDKAAKEQITNNKCVALRIIRAVIFCGERGLSLRGHQDSGAVLREEERDNAPKQRDGNFRALLRYACKSGDTLLENHLKNGSKNTMYTSPRVQNVIISACFSIITAKIVAKVNKAGAFTVLADETTDRSGVEQLALCVRYVFENTLHEEFLAFIDVRDMSGEGLGAAIVKGLRDVGIETRNMCGQGYDGGSNMKGKFRGAQSFVKQLSEAPLALYLHCESHSFNLAVSSACDIREISHCLAIVNSIQVFLKTPKRKEALRKVIAEATDGESRVRGLIPYNPTRFIERHTSIARFWDQLGSILTSLSVISEWDNAETAADAKSKYNSCLSPPFLVALRCIVSILAVCQPITRQLQSKTMDLSKSLLIAEGAIKTLQGMRANASTSFSQIFNEVQSLCATYSLEITMPRTTGRQTHRNNVPADNAEDFYRRSVYLPFLSTAIVEIQERLTAHRTVLSCFSSILPGEGLVTDGKQLLSEQCLKEGKVLFETYQSAGFLKLNSTPLEFECELLQWHIFLEKCEETLKASVMCLYNLCSPQAFPNISMLLQVLATLPVTSCTPERCFNTLKHLKSYLRCTMSEERLNGLTHLYVYEGLCSEKEVLDYIVQNGSLKKLGYHFK